MSKSGNKKNVRTIQGKNTVGNQLTDRYGGGIAEVGKFGVAMRAQLGKDAEHLSIGLHDPWRTDIQPRIPTPMGPRTAVARNWAKGESNVETNGIKAFVFRWDNSATKDLNVIMEVSSGTGSGGGTFTVNSSLPTFSDTDSSSIGTSGNFDITYHKLPHIAYPSTEFAGVPGIRAERVTCAGFKFFSRAQKLAEGGEIGVFYEPFGGNFVGQSFNQMEADYDEEHFLRYSWGGEEDSVLRPLDLKGNLDFKKYVPATSYWSTDELPGTENRTCGANIAVFIRPAPNLLGTPYVFPVSWSASCWLELKQKSSDRPKRRAGEDPNAHAAITAHAQTVRSGKPHPMGGTIPGFRRIHNTPKRIRLGFVKKVLSGLTRLVPTAVEVGKRLINVHPASRTVMALAEKAYHAGKSLAS